MQTADRDAQARIVYGNYAPRIRSEWDVAQALAKKAPGPEGRSHRTRASRLHATGMPARRTASKSARSSAARRSSGKPPAVRQAERWIRQEAVEADRQPVRPSRGATLVRVAWLLLLADAATWAGCYDFLLGRHRGAAPGGSGG